MLKNNIRENGTCIIKNDHVNRCFILNENGVLNNNQYKYVMRCINNEILLSCSLYDELKEME